MVTCEHGGNRIPAAYRQLFRGQQTLLDSHRGHDPGALVMATALAESLGAPLVASTTSRLLIDLNRSIGHRDLFSSATRDAPAETRAQIVADHYLPYRTRAESLIATAIANGNRMIHISAHSFAGELGGRVRSADVGLLYDPGRRGETALCARWKQSLAVSAPQWRVRRNYPYAGKADGLTSHLRQRFGPRHYIGVELEINQDITLAGERRWKGLRSNLIDSLQVACSALVHADIGDS